ncbi:RHS repeat domain-containing protein [Streptacidiphilus sp. N1-3]|uniref:RHS repeat domain-containing protein n=1 Tax=Streptacidiphilus alkalitolerans TaxID=3342712 RepID=A0ABV6XAC4_9ACTN
MKITPQAVGGGTYHGPNQVRVSVKSQAAASAAGIDGLLFSVAPSGSGQGSTKVQLDYSAFDQAYGGAFGSRLTLVQMPACVLTTPQVASCRSQRPLDATNDAKSKQLTASLQLTAPSTTTQATAAAAAAPLTVIAAISGASGGDGGGPAGSFGATSLKAAGSWTAGGSNGSFQYSYQVAAPSSGSTLVPNLGLSYDSGSVDGQTAASNSQSSWVGDGWSMPESFIEESFTSCADKPEGTASPTVTNDQCYDGAVLTLSLNGVSTALVQDSAGHLKTANDNGDIVNHVTGAANSNGSYNTDYYTVTDRSGTVFSFGLNHLPGWTSGKAATNSVDTEPVYSSHKGDPCYNAAGFTSSVCTMGYRYNLDYVKDVNGAAMSYYYNQDTNYYGQDNGAKNTSYVRDSHLDHIDYGFTDGHAYGTVADEIKYTAGERCVAAACDPMSTNKANWLDVPYDQVCASGATCTAHSPAFFSTVRLASITTKQWNTTATTPGWNTVDTYTLSHTMPLTADGDATLWLASIVHSGSDSRAGGPTTAKSLPAVSFGMIDMPNRVDTTLDGLPGLYRYRIATVTTETGSVIGVQYGQTDPCTAPVTTNAAANTSSCYPVYWTPKDLPMVKDWFNKYVVQKITQSDPTGGAPLATTAYDYKGAAWHYDDNELVKAQYRTYGQWRGYQDVTIYNGDATNDKQTKSETTYYQGMSDDNNTTAVDVKDSQNGSHDDNNLLAGSPLETTSYLGSGGAVDHSTITSYWVSPATATRIRTGLPALTANLVVPVETWSRQALTAPGATGWRITETDNTYDATTSDTDFGLQTASYSHTVPAQAAYDRCTTTGYAMANTALNLVGLVSNSETDSLACAGYTEGSVTSVPDSHSVNALTAPASVSRPGQVVSATRNIYDDPTDAKTWPTPALTFPQTTAPAQGKISISQKASGYTAGAFTWVTSNTQLFDSAGRDTDAYDSAGNHTNTAYTVDSAGLVTGISATNPLGQSTHVTLDPARNLTLTSTDINGVVSTSQYDTLGRAIAGWSDSRPTTAPANVTYSYSVSDSGPTAITTNTLDDAAGYVPSTVIYDAMLRPRQTQSATPQGGRIVTDTFYDSRGWKSATYNGWYDKDSGPNATLVSAADLKDQVPNQDYYSYDGLGRVVVDQSEKDNVEVSRTTTVYNGDRTTVLPPTGGTATTTLTDPLGRTRELDSYSTAPTLNTPADPFTGVWSVSGGTTQAISYGYDNRDNQTTTSAGGSTWTSTVNLLGQTISKSDPDAGTSTMTYNTAGKVLQTTDSRGKTISYTYDAIGRLLGSYAAPATGQSSANQLTASFYDNSNNAVASMKYPLGHLTTNISYDADHNAYTTQEMGFSVFGSSVGEKYTIPAGTGTGALAGTYTFQHSYSTNTGLPQKSTFGAAGGMAAETVSYGYTGALDLPSGVGGLDTYAQSTSYDIYGRVNQETLGAGTTTQAFITDSYDLHSGRLTDQLVTRSTAAPSTVDDQQYTYDLDGNITAQTSGRLGAVGTETQCFQYDGLDHLTQAWTANDSCAATPTTGHSSTVGDNLAGGTPYWSSWTFDALGQRQTATDHSTSGGADTSTSYAYDGNGANQPHTLTSTTAIGAAPGSTSATYDSTGNTITRTSATTGTQNLSWNDAGQLTRISGGTAGTTSYVYGPDDEVLLQQDPTSTTLYLPNEQLTLNTTTGVISGNRYYTLPGGGTAVRSGSTATGTSTFNFEISDQHGTSGLMLDSTAQIPTWRQFTPYGATRGSTVTWSDSRGFLNAPNDTATGLTLLGAREYDPDTGRFISLDPLFEATSLQQLAGYTYAGSNPVVHSDPSGLAIYDDATGCNGTIAAVEACIGNQEKAKKAASQTFDTIGGGLVSVQESDSKYYQLKNAYAAARKKVARRKDWSNTQYDVHIWETVCYGNQKLCGFGSGSLGGQIASDFNASQFGDGGIKPVLVTEGRRGTQFATPLASVGAVFGAKKLFSNRYKTALQGEIDEADELGVQPIQVGSSAFDATIEGGTIKWAVDADGGLYLMPKMVGMTELKHPVLVRGADVQAAGEADIAGSDGFYFGVNLTNASGHYLPSAESLQIGREAFEREGIMFDDAAVNPVLEEG